MEVDKTLSLAQNSDKQTLSDAELLQLFKENRTDMVAFANRIATDLNMAEDIVHEAFLRIQAKMKGGYNSNLSVKGYYYRVIRSISIDWIRRKDFENQLFPEDIVNVEDEISDNSSSLLDAVIAAEELERILDGLAKLPDRTRMALEMYRFGEYTMQAIADHFSISKSTASVLVAKGMLVCRRCRDK